MLRLHSCLGFALARLTPARLPCLAAATPWRAYSTSSAPADELDKLVDAIVDAASQRRRDANAKAIDVGQIVDAVLAPVMHPVTSQPTRRLHYMFIAPEVEDSVPPNMQMLLRAALVGAPNAGKSTLLNTLVGCKVSAVSHKTNTTLDTMVGAFTQGITQVVLFDTPGVVTKRSDIAGNIQEHRISFVAHRHYINHKHSRRVRSAWGIASQSDILVFVVDAARQVCQPDPRVLRLVTNIATLGSGAKTDGKQPTALPPPSIDTTVSGRSIDHKSAAAALTEDGHLMDLVEGALQRAVGEGGQVDRAQLEQALEALLEGGGVDEDAHEDAHDSDEEESQHQEENQASLVAESVDAEALVMQQPRPSPRRLKMGLKSLGHLQALSEVDGGQQLTDLLQQRRDALMAAKPPQTGTLAQAVCPPCILVMNKMDLLSRREKLLALRWAMRMTEMHNFDDVFYISAERRKYGGVQHGHAYVVMFLVLVVCVDTAGVVCCLLYMLLLPALTTCLNQGNP